MGKYRKKPVVVDAVQFIIGAPQPEWFTEAVRNGSILNGPEIVIRTLEGDMTAIPGDYIIRGVKGEIYPCKQEIFEATYDKVSID
ncbi:MAG: hypothetical protein ABS894_00575 [Aerococcus urinaeequi]